MYYIYLMRCSDNSLYTGITTDLSRRLHEHSSQGVKSAHYTRSHTPVGLAAAWIGQDRSAASRLEYRIKSLSKKEKEALIKGELPLGWDMSGYQPVASGQIDIYNSEMRI